MKCVAIDDEAKALDVISMYVGKIDALDLVATFTDPVEASQFLETNVVDLLFLDVNMKGLNGFELLESLSKKPQVIFTTAYSDFAVKSYHVDALDYLVKPIPFSRFMKAVNKAEKAIPKPLSTGGEINEDEIVSIKSGTAIHRIRLSELLFLESDSNYVKYFTATDKIMSLTTMKDAMKNLNDNFIQTHRSFIVAVNKVDKVESHQLRIGDRIIPIGISYRKNVLSRFGL
ncbi:MAG: LytTR family DNA-binding domain-containing protein [Cyclobacteriaceae bacterium]